MTGRLLSVEELHEFRRQKLAARRAFDEAMSRQQLPTIRCPCCGADTGVEVTFPPGRKLSPEQMALRQRMRMAGISLKRIRLWMLGRPQ